MSHWNTTDREQQLQDMFLWRLASRSYRFLCFLGKGLMVAIILLGLFYLYLQSRPLPPPDVLTSTSIYDDQGKILNQTDPMENREYVKLDQIPTYLKEATIAAEDKSFYHHYGFSLRGIARAIFVNIREGSIRQGASTITQQLARNLYLTHDRTWLRKAKEALYTLQLEIHYTKDEILEMYLNKIYYGNGAYGVQRAAQVYFQKDVSKLSLAQSSFLAGIPRGPVYYSPYEHYERTKTRQRHILDLMAKNGLISQTEAQEAKRTELVITQPEKMNQLQANYFRDYVVQAAIKQYGLEESLVLHGGLKIYTTLNQNLQQNAENAVRHYLSRHQKLEGSLLSVDPKTGHIKAMVGGKDYDTSQFNRVFAKRQPGSAFKPILYLSALENGFTPLTKIMSKPTIFQYEGKTYQPANYGNQYPNRAITLREAIAKSDNIYAVTTQFQIGAENTQLMAKRLGMKSQLKATPSLALGSYSVTPFEMVQAYSTIASGGIYRPILGITKIVDRDGTVLVDTNQESKQVIRPAHAFVLTKLLESVFDSGGTAHRVQQMIHRPIAGKTGSTDWDGWLVGYTPDLVTSVWVGYDQGRKISNWEGKLSQYIWGHYMRDATKRNPSSDFTPPEDVTGVYVDEASGFLTSKDTPNARFEYFVRGTEPQIAIPENKPIQGPSWWDKIRSWFD
ncbi:transglycosylase domain-containing protein [Risungbinella massiliensis]|uniref:transglycosylase domain-containing protein n=1 Tax=Risungbinella massiliensis TaxID=1329796 RepID=UPI0005CBD935|nr:transglycosylase domain-containing protein [Risungbinella massiliensis]